MKQFVCYIVLFFTVQSKAQDVWGAGIGFGKGIVRDNNRGQTEINHFKIHEQFSVSFYRNFILKNVDNLKVRGEVKWQSQFCDISFLSNITHFDATVENMRMKSNLVNASLLIREDIGKERDKKVKCTLLFGPEFSLSLSQRSNREENVITQSFIYTDSLGNTYNSIHREWQYIGWKEDGKGFFFSSGGFKIGSSLGFKLNKSLGLAIETFVGYRLQHFALHREYLCGVPFWTTSLVLQIKKSQQN